MSPDPGDGPRVLLEGVAKRYDIGDHRVTALEAIDLTVGAGELVVILGPSGCGKTTLLNLVGALDAPSEGRLVVGGIDLSHADAGARRAFRREIVSFVFQTFNLFPALTAFENVLFGADVSGRAQPAAAAEEVLASVGLADRLDHFPHQLSGGEQQRVAIARALAGDSPVLLADEPTGELDFTSGVQILRLLAERATSGATVLVVTHNREIARAAKRVVELSSGRLVRDGAPEGGHASIDELRW